MSLLAECAVALDDRERAEVLYASLAPYAGLVALAGSEVSIGPVDRPLGLLAASLGRAADAARHFEAAITACRRAGARPWLAHSQAGFAEMLAAGGRADDRPTVVDLANAARDVANDVGMTALRGRMDALLAAFGTRPPASAGPVRLTRREEEVAGLVSVGLSNRQIGERLFVSERTAETHVQNILTKLAFNSRSQVAAWAVRQGIDPAT
jgi:DNA-binding NarL/FixJ family response regulator